MTLTLDIPDRPPDWQDAHEGALQPPDTPARVAFRRALDAVPGWGTGAMVLRNLVVAPFGLVRSVGTATPRADFLDRLPVLRDEPDLFETGLTDRHLTFTVRVETTPGHVTARTRIWFNNAFGPVYLRTVLPVHNHLMRRMVGSLASVPSPEAANR